MRIVGVNIPDNKRIEIALTAIYGIGRCSSNAILNQSNINPGKKATELTQQEKEDLKISLESRKIEGELRREVLGNINRLQQIESWRGIRHKKGLPVRGQHTQTNNRTVRHNKRRTIFSGKRKLTKT